MVTAQPSAGYEELGYEILPGFLTEAELGAVRRLIADLVLFEASQVGNGVGSRIAAMTEEKLPHAGLLALARYDPERSRRVVDRLIASALLRTTMTGDKMLEVAAAYTGASSPDALCFDTLFFRVDLPAALDESREMFSLPWHQESGYYHRYVCKQTSVVLNVPLFDCARADGCMEICPGSHKAGPLPHDEFYLKPEEKRHLRVLLPEEIIRNHEIGYAEAHAGDLLVCHFNLIHRSGRNDSDRVRYTMLVRASNMLSENYIV